MSHAPDARRDISQALYALVENIAHAANSHVPTLAEANCDHIADLIMNEVEAIA